MRCKTATLFIILVLAGVLLFFVYTPKITDSKIALVETSGAADVATRKTASVGDIPVYGYKIVRIYPHDPKAFTQGLIYYENGVVYEGTGMWAESSLRKVELETGKVLQIHPLPPELFGEGIALWKEKLVQLTWQSQKGFVYDRETFDFLREFSYSTEGWGITDDEKHLIMSDGSATLFLWDPEMFQEIGRIEVRDQNGPVARLNELEYINGLIYANVWQSNRIAIISPETGQVIGWIDLTGLLSPQERTSSVDVLNGIAYDAKDDRLFVTGKYWPKLFQIQLIKPGQ